MITGKSITDRLHIVAAVNDEEILANNLARSPLVASGQVPLSCYRGAPSASVAYNRGIDESSAPIIVFAHQDVFLPEGWENRLARAITEIELHDPDWAVIGAFGVDLNGQYFGHVWCSGTGRRLGGRFGAPRETVSIDELLIVLRRDSGLRFDEGLPSFHLYGTDIVQMGRAAGRKSYVADLAVIHNSRPVRTYRGGYAEAWRYMQHKWRDSLPIMTLTVPITRTALPLLRAQFGLWRTFPQRKAKAMDPRVDPRTLVAQLDL
jgi:hypothetical protein